MTIRLDQFVAWCLDKKGSTHANRVRHESPFPVSFGQHERLFANRFVDHLVAPNSVQDFRFRKRFGKPHVQQVHRLLLNQNYRGDPKHDSRFARAFGQYERLFAN